LKGSGYFSRWFDVVQKCCHANAYLRVQVQGDLSNEVLYDVLSQGASNLLEAKVIGIQLHFVSLASGNSDGLQGKALYGRSQSLR